MSIYYLSPDHVRSGDPLPAVAFSADAFHEFDTRISEDLATLESRWPDRVAGNRRSPATAWRFRRRNANRDH